MTRRPPRPPKRRSANAKALALAVFRQRVMQDRRKYQRALERQQAARRQTESHPEA